VIFSVVWLQSEMSEIGAVVSFFDTANLTGRLSVSISFPEFQFYFGIDFWQ